MVAGEPTTVAESGQARPAEGVGAHSELSSSQARELEFGEGELPGGRISAAREIRSEPAKVPFTARQLARLNDALMLASRESGVDFSIYLGELAGADTRDSAERLHAALGAAAGNVVLLAVDPGRQRVEIVTGEQSHRRLPDRSCRLAVMSMVASFKEGDLYGGLLSGLRMLTEQVGHHPNR